jgi:hypothetical protein
MRRRAYRRRFRSCAFHFVAFGRAPDAAPAPQLSQVPTSKRANQSGSAGSRTNREDKIGLNNDDGIIVGTRLECREYSVSGFADDVELQLLVCSVGNPHRRRTLVGRARTFGRSVVRRNNPARCDAPCQPSRRSLRGASKVSTILNHRPSERETIFTFLYSPATGGGSCRWSVPSAVLVDRNNRPRKGCPIRCTTISEEEDMSPKRILGLAIAASMLP